MKKFLLTLAMVFSFGLAADAQFYIGGSLGLSHSKLEIDGVSEDFSGTSFKIAPDFGYQINDKWAVGLNFSFMKGYAALGSMNPSDWKAFGNAMLGTASDVVLNDMSALDPKLLTFAPYARFTFFKKKGFELFVDGMIGYNGLKFDLEEEVEVDGDYVTVSSEQKATGIEISFRPGVAYCINDHFKLMAKVGSLGYQHLKFEPNGGGDVTVSRFGLDVDGTNLLFGVQYCF